MALLFCDSVRHYSTAARIGEKWTAYTTATVNATAGRGGGPALSLGGATSSAAFNFNIQKAIAAASTLIVGFRFSQITEFASNITPIVAFRDGGTTQVCIAVNTSGNLVAYRGNPTTNLLGTSVNAINLATQYYIELKSTIDGSTGTIEVRVNGSSTGWINLTGQNTQATANATANQVWFGNASGGSSNRNRYFCDIVICDTSGSVNNDFLGEVNVDAYLPEGAGHYAQFTPSSGDNYTCVDEADPNTTDYVSSGTAGHKDTYAFADMIGNNPQIKAVANNLWALKTDSGTVYAKSLAVTGPTDSPPTEYVGDNLTPSTTYTALQHIYETNPATDAAWTKAEFNVAEFGVEIATS